MIVRLLRYNEVLDPVSLLDLPSVSMTQSTVTPTSPHHHSGFIQKSAQLYARLLQTIGEKIIGRGNAGRAGRAARIVRIISTGTSLGVGIAGIIIISTSVASGGAVVPIWIFIIGGVTLVTNSAAIAIGAAANHMKIGQYYDRQAEMHANNEALRKILDQASEPLPHGMRQYWRDERPLFNMVMGRRVHDSNGVGGTTLSIISGLASVGVAAISPDAAIALFTASRTSAVLSASGANATNWHRLKVYRNIMLRFAEDYRRLTRTYRPITAALVEKMLAAVLDAIQLDKSSAYAGLLEFHLYKAIYSVAIHHNRSLSTRSPLHIANWQKCVDVLAEVLQPFLVEHHGMHRLSRSALQKIDRDHVYTIKPEHTFMDKLAVFDALFVLEMISRLAIIKLVLPEIKTVETMAEEIIGNLKVNTSHDLATKRLRFHIISALYETSRDSVRITELREPLKQNIKTAIAPHLKPETKRIVDSRKWFGMRQTYKTVKTGATFLDSDKLANAYPVSAHAHGGNFHLNFHMERLRETIGRTLGSSPDTGHVSPTHIRRSNI